MAGHNRLNSTSKVKEITTEKTKTDTLIVGAGQAGVAMSEHLSKLGVPHLVLERNRIAGRWDSLVANGPAWHDRFTGLEFDNLSPDGFAPKERAADYFEAYAKNSMRRCAQAWRCSRSSAMSDAPASPSKPPKA
jgi:putative flavoprotein involved in K+ transport